MNYYTNLMNRLGTAIQNGCLYTNIVNKRYQACVFGGKRDNVWKWIIEELDTLCQQVVFTTNVNGIRIEVTVNRVYAASKRFNTMRDERKVCVYSDNIIKV